MDNKYYHRYSLNNLMNDSEYRYSKLYIHLYRHVFYTSDHMQIVCFKIVL